MAMLKITIGRAIIKTIPVSRCSHEEQLMTWEVGERKGLRWAAMCAECDSNHSAKVKVWRSYIGMICFVFGSQMSSVLIEHTRNHTCNLGNRPFWVVPVLYLA